MKMKNPINLLRGWPSLSLLPTVEVREAADAALSNPTVISAGLCYGPDPGYEPLREEIARWLSSFYQQTMPARICITGGASQNLACILQVFSDPLYTLNVWMVAPVYFLAARILEDNGFAGRLRAVPEDREGLDVQFLADELIRSDKEAEEPEEPKPIKPARPWRKLYRHVIYAVPTFSNPSGKIMTLERRRQLVRLARQHDALIITDDVYDFLQWPKSGGDHHPRLDRACIPRVVDVDRDLEGGTARPRADGYGNSVSNASFSKIVGPGCRTGWAEGTEAFIWGLSQVGTSRSGGAPSQLTATIISELLRSGNLQKHISNHLQPSYAARFRTMMDAIDTHLVPLGVTRQQDLSGGTSLVGGYFIWLTLPVPMSAELVAMRAKDRANLIVAHGDLFAVSGDDDRFRFGRDIRVCFAWEDEEDLSEGIRRLAGVIQEVQRSTIVGVGHMSDNALYD